MANEESIAYIIIFALCWIVAAIAFWAMKWMILNWPAERPGRVIRWLQTTIKEQEI